MHYSGIHQYKHYTKSGESLHTVARLITARCSVTSSVISETKNYSLLQRAGKIWLTSVRFYAFIFIFHSLNLH